MRTWPDDVTPDAASTPDLDALIAEGRWGDTGAALRRLEEVLPDLEHAGDPDSLLLGLYGRVQLQRLAGVPVADTIPACDVLERAAVERRCQVWVATACALRANLRMESGDVGAAMADLARVDLDQVADGITDPVGARLLDVLATAYARLRLVERLDEIRARLDDTASTLSPIARATHWAGWATELAGRAMEPVASGASEPDQRLLGRAVQMADRVSTLEPGVVPQRLRRTVDGVRALAAAYRGRPSEALRLLGQDAFGDPRDLAPLERQVVRLAATHAHALVGSIATARSLDDAGGDTSAALPHLVLEVCRARERLWLESHAGGDVVPVLQRLTDLLVRLGWQGMDLVADTARQALEHQALRTESRTDPLTGAGNRRALDEDLRHILRFTPLPMSLILVDVDDFKGVNDRFTHVVGDEVLRRVAGSLSSQLRVGDRLLRYGGDEFVVLLPRTGDQEARQVATRMNEGIAELPWTDLADGLDVRITTGSAALWSLTGRRPERDAEQLFRRADEALLDAKRQRPAPRPTGGEWRSGGRRVALREAPGPTLAPPDRPVDRPDEPIVLPRTSPLDVTGDALGALALGSLPSPLAAANATSPDGTAPNATSPDGTPPHGTALHGTALQRTPPYGTPSGTGVNGASPAPLGTGLPLGDPGLGGSSLSGLPFTSAVTVTFGPIGSAVGSAVGSAGGFAIGPTARVVHLRGGFSTHTPPLGQHALVADLLDAAETMDEAVSHVTAPGIPVITGSIPVAPRRGRRALGPPDDGPADAPDDRSGGDRRRSAARDAGRPAEPVTRDVQETAPPATGSGVRRPAVIDLDPAGGRRAAQRTPFP